ncbi:MAG: hypothetical protein R2809_03150 [Flavobacteriales bacterium]
MRNGTLPGMPASNPDPRTTDDKFVMVVTDQNSGMSAEDIEAKNPVLLRFMNLALKNTKMKRPLLSISAIAASNNSHLLLVHPIQMLLVWSICSDMYRSPAFGSIHRLWFKQAHGLDARDEGRSRSGFTFSQAC